MRARQKWKLDTVTLTTLAFVFAGMPSFAASGDEYWESFGSLPPGSYVSALAVAGRNLFVAGSFSSIGGIAATNIAKWDGNRWSPLGGGVIGTYLGAIVVRGECVYVGGYISSAGNTNTSGVAKWDGVHWSSLETGVAGVVRAMAFMGNNLFVGGSFHSAGTVAATNIARWNGTNWSEVGGGITHWIWGDPPGRYEEGVVRCLAVRDNSLFVGGDFTTAGGKSITNIAEWNGTNWSALGPGMPGYNEGVHAITVSEGRVYASGNLRWFPGVIGPGVAVWDGLVWSAIPDSNFEGVRALVFNGTDLFVGPGLNEIGPARGIAKWDGVKWSALGSGVDGAAFNLVWNGSELFVAGSFSVAGGKSSTNIALWHIPHSLSISQNGNELTLSWPATGTNFMLEAKDNATATNWSEVSSPPTVHSNECVVTDTIIGPQKFYRLRKK